MLLITMIINESINVVKIRNRGSYMSAHILLNLLTEFQNSD